MESSPLNVITHGARVNTPNPTRGKSLQKRRRCKSDDFQRPPPSQKRSCPEVYPKDQNCENSLSTPKEPEAVPSQLRGHGRKALQKGSSVIIFDWDDTLLSSTYLAGLGYRLDLVQEFPDELQQKLNDLEEHVILLLQTCIDAVGADRTVVITNAERNWVELSAKKFIPNVLPILEQCHIISARTTFEIDNTGPYEWKILAFYHKLQQAFGVRFPPPAIDKECPYYDVMKQIYESYENRVGEDTDHFSKPNRKVNKLEDKWLPCPGGGRVRAPSEGTSTSGEMIQENELQLKNAGEQSQNSTLPLPKAMLLSEQEAFTKEDHSDVLIHDEFLDDARRALSPWQLEHAGLNFKGAESYEEVLAEPKYVISFGDSLAEKHATQTVTRTLQNSVFKTIKFLERPSIRQVIKQLDLVLEHMQFFVECEDPLDIVLALDTY